MSGSTRDADSSTTERRVWVLGLDGATFDLIKSWVDEGHLPVLGELMRQGTWGNLTSTYPPLTGPAWSSFMTGKSPARHGILEFFRREPGTYRQVLNSVRDIDGKTLWRILSDAGKRVVVMGVPLTYPPEQVNGCLITGLLTPAGCDDFTHPRSLREELVTQLGEYRLRHDEKYRPNNPTPFIREQYEILENNTQAALYLMRNKPWDFFMVHLLGTDRMQHEFWHLLDPAHPRHDPAERERLGNVILDFMKKVDESIGRMLDALDGDPVVLVMSDHGFGPAYRFVNFNTWLLQQGLLRLQRRPATWVRHLLFRLGFNYQTAAQWILNLGLGRQAVELGRARREELQRKLFLSLDDVDWSRSRAYSMGNFGQIYLNVKGREPEGTVEPGVEYEELMDDLSQALEGLIDPETGETVIDEIVRRDDVYAGPYASHSPDLMFYTREMSYKAMGLSDFSSPHVFDDVYGTTGHHRMNGVMLWHGPGIMTVGQRYDLARIHDLAPTILYLMGQPIPRSMDGQVLFDLIEPQFRRDHAVTHVDDDQPAQQGDHQAYSEHEQAEMRELLRGLGYVT
jgi:predicted AlkP superfamily phosphohydrolase/phosphomutase